MTQAELADAVGVSGATMSRWLDAKTPPSKGLSKLVAWAERYTQLVEAPTPPLPAEEVIARAAKQTRRNLVRLSEISGYAKRVLEEMRSVTASQERVVDQLAPYVLLEEEVYGDPVELADTIEDITRDAREKQAGETPTPGASPRRKRTSGGG
jgi:transcriptional regulator with XRE-family HTH domain